MSARAEMLPEPYIRRFSKLQGDIPVALTGDDVTQLLDEAYADVRGGSAALFAEIDRTRSLGAASIGQTHFARLAGAEASGEKVCVKVQYPEAQLLFYVDLSCIRTVARLMVPMMLPILTEMQRAFLREFDYRTELTNIQQMVVNRRDPRNKYFTEETCELPDPLPELCRERVLVMRFLRGLKVELF